MRILHVVAGEKWTGVAAVACDWTRALRDAGVEAQFAFVGGHNLEKRLLPAGWARPLLSRTHGPWGIPRDARALRETILRERFDVVHAHRTHDHALAALARRRTPARLARTIHHLRHVPREAFTRALFARTDAFAFGNTEIARAFGAPGPVHLPVVDASVFAPGPKPAALPGVGTLSAGRFVAGTVGKMARGRGHEEAIAAMAPLPRETCLLHVGKGEHRPALESPGARPRRRATATSGPVTRTRRSPLSIAPWTFSSSPPPAPSRVSARSSKPWPPGFRSSRFRCPASAIS